MLPGENIWPDGNMIPPDGASPLNFIFRWTLRYSVSNDPFIAAQFQTITGNVTDYLAWPNLHCLNTPP